MKRTLLKLAVSVGLLAVIATQTDLSGVGAALGQIPPSLLVLVIAIQLLQFAVLALRWSIILRAAGLGVGWWQGFRLLSAAMAANQVMPSSLGADLVRAWLVRQAGAGGLDALGTVVADRVAGLLSLALLGIATAYVAGGMLPPGAAWVPWLALVMLGTGAALVIGLTGRLERWPALAPAATAVRRFRDLAASPGPIASILVLSIAAHALTALCLWLLVRAAGVEVGYIVALAALPPIVLALLLPISVAGWGVREGLVVGLFGLLGARPEAALEPPSPGA